jgi:magnesium transporter
MIKTYTYQNIAWLDLESPTREEVRELMQRYELDPLVCEELIATSFKPKVDVYQNCIYLILHFPTLKKGDDDDESHEVDFVIGKDFIITAHYDTMDPLHSFSKLFEVNSILDKSNLGEHAGFIFFYMIRELYKNISVELDAIRQELKHVEQKIFRGDEKKMVAELSKISRDLLDLKESTSMHKSVLESFEVAGGKFFGQDFAYNLKLITEEYYSLASAIRENREFLQELRDTNDSLLDYKQNETMKTFTVLAFIFLPLSFVSSLFINAEEAFPSLNTPREFWVVTLCMAIFALVSILLFRYKDWL